MGRIFIPFNRTTQAPCTHSRQSPVFIPRCHPSPTVPSSPCSRFLPPTPRFSLIERAIAFRYLIFIPSRRFLRPPVSLLSFKPDKSPKKQFYVFLAVLSRLRSNTGFSSVSRSRQLLSVCVERGNLGNCSELFFLLSKSEAIVARCGPHAVVTAEARFGAVCFNRASLEEILKYQSIVVCVCPWEDESFKGKILGWRVSSRAHCEAIVEGVLSRNSVFGLTLYSLIPKLINFPTIYLFFTRDNFLSSNIWGNPCPFFICRASG